MGENGAVRAKHRWFKERLSFSEISRLPTVEERAQALLRRVDEIEEHGKQHGLTASVQRDLRRLRGGLQSTAAEGNQKKRVNSARKKG